MLSVPLLKQLLAAQQLCAGAAAVSSATQRLCLNPQRSTSALGIATQAAPSPDASSSASAEDSSAAAAGQQQQHLQQQSWLPSRALPASSVYGVKITIKAHDLIFVKMASTAIRDLVLVNFAPKSRDVLPELWRLDGSGVPWVNLAMPIGDRAIPTRRTHFTVISGPHVHKTAREQFARTTHTRVVQVGTNNLSELNWLLHSIKMYKFVGVELSFRITSSSYLIPTSTSQQDAAQQPLLTGHKHRFANLFGAAAPSNSSSDVPARPSSSTSYAALQQSLQGLESVLNKGLLQQRLRLSAANSYERWQETGEGLQAGRDAAAGATAGAQTLPQQQLRNEVAQQLEGSSLLAATDEGKGGSSLAAGSREQALLSAVDKLLAGIKTDGLDRHKFFPFLMAFYQLDKHQLPPAEWMQAILMFAKQRQREVDAAAARQQPLVQSYGQVSRALLLLLLQEWYKSVDAAGRRQLVMPRAGQVEDMLSRGARGGAAGSSS